MDRIENRTYDELRVGDTASVERTLTNKDIDLFAALSEGGQVHMPMADQPWGDYYGDLQDRFGIHWMINYHKED